MSTAINPQEIYLLERYTSLSYFGEMRDAYGVMIKFVEARLEHYMDNLPLDYRSLPLPEQPDAVWGEHVLPHFRSSFQSLCTGYIELAHGDVTALGYANAPKRDFRGQLEYWADWMGEVEVEEYRRLFSVVLTMASNIDITEGGRWSAGALGKHYEESNRGSLNPPVHWPQYKLNSSIQVASGQSVKQNGIYLPNIADSCAEFLSNNYDESPEASVLIGMRELFHPATKIKYGETPEYEKRPCIWTLVERVSDDGGMTSAPSLLNKTSHRVEAKQPCPETGFYFTPAQANSRRHFKQGDLMPSVSNDYGMAIWQWDDQQS